MISSSSSPASQMIRNNAFTLTGNTQGNQIASMTGAACQTDWLMIPCASNLGRLPTAMTTCVDRICGGTFNADSQNLNSSSVVSAYFLIHTKRKSYFCFYNNNIFVGTVKPFRLIFHTDSIEAPNDIGNKGFCLNYVQQPCTTKLR